MRYTDFFVICTVLAAAAAAKAGEVSTIEELNRLEKQVIEARRSISSGRVVLEVRSTVMQGVPQLVGPAKRYTLLFEGDRSRADLVWPDDADASRSVVLTPDTFIRAPKARKPVMVFGPKSKPSRTIEIPDPRLLGFVNWSFDPINALGYEDTLLRKDRHDIRIEQDVVEEMPVTKVSYRLAPRRAPTFGEYWLSTKQGNLPIYIAAWVERDGQREGEQSLRCELHNYGKNEQAVWYPKQTVFRQTKDGEVVEEQVVTVEEAEFLQDIDDKEFTLAGLGLEQGRVVDYDGRRMYWSGEGLKPVTSGADPPGGGAGQVAGAPGGNGRLLLLNAGVFALLGAAVSWRWWLESRKARHLQ